MLASERLDGLRIVASPAALDTARYTGATYVWRIAIDEVFAVGAVHAEVDDPYAIIERETAFVAWQLSLAEFQHHVARHIEWTLPTERPALAQGLIAALPLKLWLELDHVLVIASSGLAHEVIDRLGVPA